MSDPEKALGRSIGQPLMGELTVGEPDDVKELTDGASWSWPVWSSPSRTRRAIPRGR